MNNKKSVIFAVLLSCLVISIWGITFVSTKHLLNDFSALEILFIRFILAYIFLWVMAPRRLKIEQKKQEIYFAFAGLTGISIYQLFENIAIHFTNASNVSIIVSICPMFAAILSKLILKERTISRHFVIGFIISIFGVMLVTFNGALNFHLNPVGDILALIAAISWGFYSILISKINNFQYDSICATRRIFFYAILFMIPYIIFGYFFKNSSEMSLAVNFSLQDNFKRFSKLLNWVNLIFLSLGASSFCFTAWNKACSILGTVKTTIGIYLIPVVTFIFASIFLGEKLTLMGAIGAVFTIAGVVISNLRFNPNK